MAQERCPHCGAPAAPSDFQCPRCELILNVEAPTELHSVDDEADEVTEPSIVRALLSPPARTLTREIPARPSPTQPGEDTATGRYSIPMDASTLPRLIAGVDVALKPMHPFEAYVASFIDGSATVGDIAREAKLGEIEVRVVLKTLLERGAVELRRRESRELEPLQERFEAGPPPPEAVLQRAIALERKGEHDGAIQVLKIGIGRSPKAAPLFNKLALILVSHRQDYGQAEELLKRALELDPGNPVYEQNLYKVVGLAAASGKGGKKGGLLSRLLGRS